MTLSSGENKRKHLELIQGVINRLASNSFTIKGWAVTLVTAVFGLVIASSNKNLDIFWIAFVPVLPFWILDSYFLWQERLYRALYSKVSKKDEAEIDFDMNAAILGSKTNTFLSSFASLTLVLFYLSLILIIVLVVNLIPIAVK